MLPPAPPGQTDTQLAQLAIEVAQHGDPLPVPFDAAGPPRHGGPFDRFLVGVLKARAAIVSGTALDSSTATPALVQGDLVAVAFPLECDGRTIAPSDLHISVGGTRPGPLPETGQAITGEALAARLPGAHLPRGAVGRGFVNAGFSQNLEVRVSYEAPCGAESEDLTLPIQWVRGSAIRRMGTAKIPAGINLPSPLTVQMRGLVDLNGAYRFPTVADGPHGAGSHRGGGGVRLAVSTLSRQRRAHADDCRRAADVHNERAAAVARHRAAAAELGTRRSWRGRRRADDPARTSRRPMRLGWDPRPVSARLPLTRPTGFQPEAAIKTGGGPAQGPARERRYLAVLRGPAGQGLHVVRRGSLMAPDRATILDQYESVRRSRDTASDLSRRVSRRHAPGSARARVRAADFDPLRSSQGTLRSSLVSFLRATLATPTA